MKDTHWSYSSYNVDFRDAAPGKIGHKVLLECLVALRHC